MQQSLPDHFAYLLKDAKRKGKNITKTALKGETKKIAKEANQNQLLNSYLLLQERQHDNHLKQESQNQDLQQIPFQETNVHKDEQNQQKQEYLSNFFEKQENQEQHVSPVRSKTNNSLMWKREKHLQTICLPKKRLVDNTIQIASDLFVYERAYSKASCLSNTSSLNDFPYETYLNVPLGAYKKVRRVAKYHREGRVELSVWTDGESTKSWKSQVEQYDFCSSLIQNPTGHRIGQDNNNISDVILNGLEEHAEIKLQQLINQTDFNSYVYAVNFGVDSVTNKHGVNTVYYSNSLLNVLGNVSQGKNLHSLGGVIDILQLLSPHELQEEHQNVSNKKIVNSNEDTNASENQEQYSCQLSPYKPKIKMEIIQSAASAHIAQEQYQINTSDFMQIDTFESAKCIYLKQFPLKTCFLRTLDGFAVPVEISHSIEDLGEDYLAMFPESGLSFAAPKFIVSIFKLSIAEDQLQNIKSKREKLVAAAPSSYCCQMGDNRSGEEDNSAMMKYFLDKFYNSGSKASSKEC